MTKKRRCGLTVGGLIVSTAATTLAGWDFMCDLDTQRRDGAGLELRAVPDVPASTTLLGVGSRFDDEVRARVGRADATLGKKASALLRGQRRTELAEQPPTIDLDPTDTGVYGRKKEARTSTTRVGTSTDRTPRCAVR
ncbi:MAG: hypothetical protein ACYC0E_06515 [Acidimicrobiales bacterium]